MTVSLFLQACNSDQYVAVPRDDMVGMLKKKGLSNSHSIIGKAILSKAFKDESAVHYVCSYFVSALITSLPFPFKNKEIQFVVFFCRTSTRPGQH